MTLSTRPPLVMALLLASLPACSPANLDPTGAAPGGAQSITVVIEPAELAMQPGATTRFTSTLYGSADSAVVWSVQETAGGRVDDLGVYTAPGTPGTYHVVAASAADVQATSSAAVTVVASPTTTPTPASHDLSTSVSPSGGGSITCNSSACTSGYAAGTALTLRASPVTGYTFSSWGGDCSGTGSCSLTMNANHTVTANFVAATGTCDTVQSIIAEMTVAGEQTSNGWGAGPQVNTGNTIPWWADSITSWSEIYRDHTISSDTNTRIEVRDMALWVKMSATAAWQRIDWTMDVTGNDKLYREDYSGQMNYTPRREPSGGVSVKIPAGYIFHFWPTDGNVKHLPGISVRPQGQNSTLQGIFVVVQARLILDNPAGTDDRASARYVMSNGADYYGSGTCCSESIYTPNGEIGTSRKKYITSDWQWFNFFSSQSSTYIQANQPPQPCSQ